jgi:hypothetical protein
MATAQPTTDPNEIRQWVEARGGHPARVKQTGSRKDPGVLRIDFPGFSGEDTLEEIEWDEFFEWFNRNRLAMLLSDEEGNRFNKLVSRSTVRKSSAKKSSSKKSSAKKSSAKKSSKKSSAKKSSAKKSSAKKSSAKKSSAKKASAKKATTRKASPAKKSSAKKSSAKKSSASAKRASSKKTSSKKETASRKPASSKKASAKKSSAKKSSAKKASPSRRVAAATTARKASAKKADAKRSASSTTTTDHDEIRKWVESRGGFPAHVKQTGRKRGDLGVLRIDYPGYSGRDTLDRIDWEQWLDAFDRNKLAFLYQNKRGSRFSKLVNR